MASENLHTITQANFNDEVLKSAQPVLIDFWAPWCGPCRMIAPIVEQLAGELAGRLKVGKLNVDENSAIASQYGVMSIPTLMVFKNGQPVERVVGLRSKKDLQAAILSHL
ncbi:MAG: thioredoxin [Bacillota bacterium]